MVVAVIIRHEIKFFKVNTSIHCIEHIGYSNETYKYYKVLQNIYPSMTDHIQNEHNQLVFFLRPVQEKAICTAKYT